MRQESHLSSLNWCIISAQKVIYPLSLQFSRSMRSLRIDSFRASKVGLLLAALIMVLLIIWFFFARVTLYEVSTSLSFNEEGRLLASFSEEALKRLRNGQPAIVRLNATGEQEAVVQEGVVFSVDAQNGTAEILVLAPEFSPASAGEKPAGRVEVEVEYVTPAELVLRSSGQYLMTNQSLLSPSSTSAPGQP
jgi:hypothetical protein